MTVPTRSVLPAAASGAVTVLVCSTCRREDDPVEAPRAGSRLFEDVRASALGTGVTVRQVACLGNCKRGLTAAILRGGCWSYVFGGLDEASGADLVAGARLFAESTDGLLPFRARPEALKRGLVARIPHPDLLEELP